MRIVGSLWCPSKRISSLEPVLKSITTGSQSLDSLYLTIGESCPYPEYLDKYCTVLRVPEHPLNCILGALVAEDDPNTIIIVFDSGKIYPEGLIEKLLSKHDQYPDSALGCAGIKLGSFPFYYSSAFNQYDNKRWFNLDITNAEEVDIINNSEGALYLRGFFSSFENYINNLDITPDVLISGILSVNDVPRRIFKMPQVKHRELKNPKQITLLKSVHRAKKEGMFAKRATYRRNRTFTFPFIIGGLAFIVFCLLLLTRQSHSASG